MEHDDELTDALLDVSRALVAVTTRSFDELAGDLTLPQFRALVVLHRFGPLPVSTLAAAVGVHQSSATRIAARLHRARLVTRAKSPTDRRLTVVGITGTGHALVDRIVERRRQDIAAVVRHMPAADVETAVVALRAFSRGMAAMGAPDRDVPAGRAVGVADVEEGMAF